MDIIEVDVDKLSKDLAATQNTANLLVEENLFLRRQLDALQSSTNAVVSSTDRLLEEQAVRLTEQFGRRIDAIERKLNILDIAIPHEHQFFFKNGRPLSTRALTSLKMNGFTKIEDLTSYSASTLLSLRGIGTGVLDEIIQLLQDHDLKLIPDPLPEPEIKPHYFKRLAYKRWKILRNVDIAYKLWIEKVSFTEVAEKFELSVSSLVPIIEFFENIMKDHDLIEEVYDGHHPGNDQIIIDMRDYYKENPPV